MEEFLSKIYLSDLHTSEMLSLILFCSTKATSEGGVDNNGAYVWNKLDADVVESYSPPVLENSDVPDLQRNRVRIELRTRDFRQRERADCAKLHICPSGVRRAASCVHHRVCS